MILGHLLMARVSQKGKNEIHASSQKYLDLQSQLLCKNTVIYICSRNIQIHLNWRKVFLKMRRKKKNA